MLRSAEAANEARRHLVGEDDAVGHGEIGHVIGAGHGAVHAVERSGHGRAQEGAVILEIVEAQRRHAAIARHCGLDRGDAVGARACGLQVFETVLDPFHRPADDAGGEAHEDDVGKDGELDAEAAAARGRRAQAELGAGHAQRARHHRMDRERSLEIGENVIAPFRRQMLRDDDETLHRREGIARIFDGERDARRGAGEGAIGIAIAEVPGRDLVGAGFGMDEHGVLGRRRARIDHRRQRRVVDRDQLGRVFGAIAVVGDDERHRLADIAHPPDRERPLRHRRLERDEKRVGERPHILARDDGVYPRQRARSRGVNAADLGMRVRRAHDMGMERVAADRNVVDIAPAPHQQRAVLDAPHRPAEEPRRFRWDIGVFAAAHRAQGRSENTRVAILGGAANGSIRPSGAQSYSPPPAPRL
jgi:hypothetical protein